MTTPPSLADLVHQDLAHHERHDYTETYYGRDALVHIYHDALTLVLTMRAAIRDLTTAGPAVPEPPEFAACRHRADNEVTP